MKKYLSLFLIMLMFCAVVSAGCGGGGGDSGIDAPDQTDNPSDDTLSYNPEDDGGRGMFGPGIDLSTITSDYTVQTGATLTGTLRSNVKISIADGAIVFLRDVTIDGSEYDSSYWDGITCLGSASIFLMGNNYVKGFGDGGSAGISVPGGKSLSISGSGSLTAVSGGKGAGIGSSWYDSCGNIMIIDGIINATGGEYCAGIGSSGLGECGNITINGGTVTATGGDRAAGIGGGYDSECGNITISNRVTRVTAIAGYDAPNSIGAGLNGTCGTVRIGGELGEISEYYYTYQP
ncbi:MAG: hypothetical protein IJS28_10445 [Synergistaceae bacterium]|nr:hypothetical protein [Synergistaceae bacterium]